MAVEAKTGVSQVLESIKKMTIVEVADLVQMIEEEFGITAIAATAPTGTSNAQADQSQAQEATEKSNVSVILKSAGGSKIPVIKEVRSITGLGLKEAKDLVEAGGKALKENVLRKEAEEIKKKLEDLGASVELK